MAVLSSSITVAVTATLLSGTDPGQANTGSPDGMSIWLRSPSGAATVYLGGAGVTAAAGTPLAAGESVAFDLAPGDALYGIVATGTQAVNVLRTGV